MVQILGGAGMPRNANVPWRHFCLNRSKTRKIRCNTLRYFPLQGFNKHLPWFRCGGKGEHLNLSTRQNPAANSLTTNALQDFQQLRPRFRSQAGLECRGMQMYPGGTSGRGIHQTRSRTAHASEPERNSKNPLQLIEKLSITRFQQASSLVQMQWKRGASEPYRKTESGSQLTHNKRVARFQQLHPWFRSLAGMEHRRTQMRPGGVSGRGIHQTRNRTAHASEPCHKAESGSQPTHSKRVARISATTPVVQIPTGSGTPQNTNTPRGTSERNSIKHKTTICA